MKKLTRAQFASGQINIALGFVKLEHFIRSWVSVNFGLAQPWAVSRGRCPRGLRSAARLTVHNTQWVISAAEPSD